MSYAEEHRNIWTCDCCGTQVQVDDPQVLIPDGWYLVRNEIVGPREGKTDVCGACVARLRHERQAIAALIELGVIPEEP